MPETWFQLIKELGGGLSAIVTLGLAYAAWTFLGWFRAAQSARIDDMREGLKAQMDQAATNEKVAAALTSLSERIGRS